GGYEVVQDAVGHVLVERALVSERPHVELHRLQLDDVMVGHVADPDGGEVRLPRARAEARGLRDLAAHLVIAIGVRIRDDLEGALRLGGHGPTLPRAPPVVKEPAARARSPRGPRRLERPETAPARARGAHGARARSSGRRLARS